MAFSVGSTDDGELDVGAELETDAEAEDELNVDGGGVPAEELVPLPDPQAARAAQMRKATATTWTDVRFGLNSIPLRATNRTVTT
ncbi:MAG: hypothetical protein JF587_13705 [Catenulisporales bacterium]|nr:hypothetical protein [Catenulisporales bacterium]